MENGMLQTSDNIFYVYCHVKKTNGECFYIGKGKKYRHKSKGGRNKYWKNIVNKYGFESIILVNNLSEDKAFELEAIICNKIGYENLCNIRNEYGDGGWSNSQETKDKISIGRRKYLETHSMPDGCRYFSPERKLKASNTWNKIWEKDNGEIAAKISAARKGVLLGKGRRKTEGRRRPIICETLFGMEFSSSMEACEILGLSNGAVCQVLKRNKFHTKGLVFRYA